MAHYKEIAQMKYITKEVLLAFTLIMGVSPVFAGPGHDHSHADGHSHSHSRTEVDELNVKNTAQFKLKRYVIDKKLERSWYDLPIDTIEKKEFNSKLEWVVTFYNPKEQDAKKQKLHIFVNLYGEITGANFTGQ